MQSFDLPQVTSLFEAIPVAVSVMHLDDVDSAESLRIVFANRACEELYGFPSAQVAGKRLREIYPSTFDARGYAETCRRTIVDQTPVDLGVLAFSEVDTDERILEVSIFPLGPEHCVALVDNLSTRNAQGTALAAIVESSIDAIFSWGLDGTILTWNAGAELMLGVTRDEIVGQNLANLMPSSRLDEYATLVHHLTANEPIPAFESSGNRSDGTVIELSVTVSPLTDRTGRVAGAATILRDVSARNKAESRLQLHTAMVAASLNAIVSEDLDTTITEWNPTAQRFFGYSALEMIGRRFEDLELRTLNNQRVVMEEIRAKVRRGIHVAPQELQVRRKDGTWVDVLRVLAPILDDTGEVVGFINSLRDLTDQRQLEQQLRQTQKMEAVGRLTGGIAHDFNNMLLVIRGYSAQLAKNVHDKETLEDIRHIDQAAQRGAEFTRKLLAFGREQILRPEEIDLNEAIDAEIAFLTPMLGDGINIECDLAHDAGTIMFDCGQLEQMILNLALNARDAMPDGGTLSVKTARVQLDARYVSGHAGAESGPHVMLQISDSGVGMDAETKRKIFDPFFTTKTDGSGLGLATLYGIMKQSSGHVWAYSEPGMGATFKLYIPLSLDAPTAAVPAPMGTTLHGSEMILLVEDTDAVRALVKTTLLSYGYTVIEASSGAEAIEAALEHRDEIQLMVTDVVMPYMNGRELAEQLLTQLPDLKILFTSGYPADTIIRSGIVNATANFLEKPYLLDDLARAVRGILDN